MSYTLTFWGTRGSIPTPGPKTHRYGGNTPCVGITARDGRLVVLDAGTGLRALGDALMRSEADGAAPADGAAERGYGGAREVDLLLSHTHWDHIQGLPFFKPLSVAGTRVRIYGAAQDGVSLGDILRRQMDPMVFPVPLTALAATLSISEIGEGSFEIGPFQVSTFCLRHPGTTLGFRLRPRDGGGEIAYLTDNELGPGGRYRVPAGWRTALIEFLGGIDTLIHDAMYSEGIIRARAGWGHSTPREAVELAGDVGCRRLILFHHDPEHDDDTIDNLLRDARAHGAHRAKGLEVDAAREGMTISL
ncbi:MAG TPA: MBL fold metallo-hydrolase [Gemmatimonadales bacterium]|nr:MBL fold metallo-hydrolase [Gemmatimonadales bacterium]